MTADSHPGSPKADYVYMTWTRFADTSAGVGSHSPIYFSQSSDGGATWSPGIEISEANAGSSAATSVVKAIQTPATRTKDRCRSRGADGTVYVAFGNGNSPNLGENQVLFVSCPGTADCTNPASWTPPSKVGDLIDKQPIGPDPTTGCPFGRQCLPTNGYRLDDFVEISPSIADNGYLFVSWADFRNGGGTCDWNNGAIGSARTATPPCDNDVFYASSTDGGATWGPTINVTPASSIGASAQWQPWSAVTTDGNTLWVAYYDRSYGDCEFTGCNDISLAKVANPTSAQPNVSYTRLTTGSMPNLVPSNNPLKPGSWGIIWAYQWITRGMPMSSGRIRGDYTDPSRRISTPRPAPSRDPGKNNSSELTIIQLLMTRRSGESPGRLVD